MASPDKMAPDSTRAADTEALIEKARRIEFYRGDLETLGKLLPEDDEALVALLEGRIDALQGRVFSHLWMAAHWMGRRVPARLLERGAEMLTAQEWIHTTAPRCTEPGPGDEGGMGICEALTRAVERHRMNPFTELICLICAAQAWRDSRRDDEPIPDRLEKQTRRVAREFHAIQKAGAKLSQILISMLAYQTDCEALKRLLRERYPGGYNETVAKITAEKMIERFSSLENIVPERRPVRVLSGYQVRRAVPKVGRNEPCPCGSGKRYKKCCIQADQEKLLRSSAVAGKTLDQLEQEKEERLTSESLRHMRPHQVMRLDPTRIREDMIQPVIRQLLSFGELDHALTIYEKSPYPDWGGWEETFKYVFAHALSARRFDLALKLADRFPEIEAMGTVDLEFIRARGDQAATLALLERHCRRLLELENTHHGDLASEIVPEVGTDELCSIGTLWMELATALQWSDLPCLTLTFARAVLPLIPQLQVDFLLERMEALRDLLGFSLFDVSEDLANLGDRLRQKNLVAEMEERLSTTYSSRLENTSMELEHRNRELADLKRSLQETSARAEEAETKAREKESALETLKAESPEAADRIAEKEAEIAELRGRLRTLKSEVKHKHNQRNDLRRELRQARQEAEERHSAPSPPTDAEARADAAEEALLETAASLPEAAAGGYYRPRIPHFPPAFLERLRSFPGHVQCAALQMAGRLASGDSTAYAGVKMLKGTRDLLRQRLSGHYRMLFQIHGDRLEILDVIDRRDLARWLQKR